MKLAMKTSLFFVASCMGSLFSMADALVPVLDCRSMTQASVSDPTHFIETHLDVYGFQKQGERISTMRVHVSSRAWRSGEMISVRNNVIEGQIAGTDVSKAGIYNITLGQSSFQSTDGFTLPASRVSLKVSVATAVVDLNYTVANLAASQTGYECEISSLHRFLITGEY